MEKYTVELYDKFQKVIDKIEDRFFVSKGKQSFPEIVFAINNSCKSCVTAFVQPDALYDKSSDKKLQYMAINPRHLDRSCGEILATICHELCHIYENAYIHIPRGGYHDKAWSELMKDCGLNPVFLNSSKTSVSTDIVKGGEFEKFVEEFVSENTDYFSLVEYSQEVEHKTKVALGLVSADGTEDEDQDDTPKADNADKPIKKYNRNKVKYTCPGCELKMWGKPGLKVLCCECNVELESDQEDPETSEDIPF